MKKTVLMMTLLAAPSAYADDYVLEADHSYASFKVMHMSRGELTGVFKDVQGKLRIDKGEVKKVDVDIAVASVDTFSPARDAHLKSPDYFNARRYPKMKFRSTKINKQSDGSYRIEGQLTVRGKTRSIVAKGKRGVTGKDPFGGQRTGGNVYLTINRRDFGITHMPAELVGDEIVVDLYWEALEKSTVQTYAKNLAKALGQ